MYLVFKISHNMENNASYNIIARARSIYQCQGRWPSYSVNARRRRRKTVRTTVPRRRTALTTAWGGKKDVQRRHRTDISTEAVFGVRQNSLITVLGRCRVSPYCLPSFSRLRGKDGVNTEPYLTSAFPVALQAASFSFLEMPLRFCLLAVILCSHSITSSSAWPEREREREVHQCIIHTIQHFAHLLCLLSQFLSSHFNFC